MLCVILINVIMLCVILINVIMLCVILLNIIMLSLFIECHGAIIMAKSLAFVKTIGDSVIGILLVEILPLLI